MWRAIPLRAILIFALSATATLASAAVAQGDVKVSDHAYVRQDGGTDSVIANCNNSLPTKGSKRQQNEPTVAIDPSETNVVVAGANDYCAVPSIGDAWMGLYVSTDGGSNWKGSLNPGYPGDTSAAGQASPIFGRAGAAGDPIMGWDQGDRLFYGGISFNRTVTNESGFITPTNGDMIVSTWVRDTNATKAPLGIAYVRTVIVGEGTPSAFFFGRFNDKPSLAVDTWTASSKAGNVYVSWTLFPGAGLDQVLFSRSTDHGATFSTPIKISKAVANAQGSDIGVAPDGAIYVVWRQFAFPASGVDDAIVLVKSTDGGLTFSDPRTIRTIIGYDREDRHLSGGSARDCGDGPFACSSGFTFHRTDTLPAVTVDEQGSVHAAWEQLDADVDNGDTYHPDGQAQVVVSKSTNGGATWSTPAKVDPQAAGHQWWPNLAFDKSTNALLIVYYDSRSDPFYSANRPPGNKANGTSSCGVPAPAVCDVLNAYAATSTDHGAAWTPALLSTVGHQPEYEMFGGRRVPFHGDYIWVDAAGGKAVAVWTDNRDVVPGSDPRDATADGFDVLQCRTSASAPDTCPNAGGLNQNIYGAGVP